MKSESGAAATRLKWPSARAISTGDAITTAPASHDSAVRPTQWRASRNVHQPESAMLTSRIRLNAAIRPTSGVSGSASTLANVV